MRVDEPGRDDASRGVDDGGDLTTIRGRKIADPQDAVAQHADVRASSWRAGPIDYGAAANEQVEGGHAQMMPPGTATSPKPRWRASILRGGRPNGRPNDPEG